MSEIVDTKAGCSLPPRVLVAMSGGVDSSVAAALLVEQGYDCSGLTMRLHPDLPDARENACCRLSDIGDAYAVATQLGIDYHVKDFSEAFERYVVDYFVRSYAAGLTPNPCIACNRHIKFGFLHRYAAERGFDYVATGHYARILRSPSGYQLHRAHDLSKDQSYVLHMADQEVLSRLLLPLGELTKDEVRAEAARRGLRVAAKRESQDICFVGKEGYASFVVKRSPVLAEAGPIVDRAGQQLGYHRGLVHYTPGQRRGIGVAAPEPLYVLEKDVATNCLCVGSAAELAQSEIALAELSWVSGEPEPVGSEVDVVVRYRGHAHSARIKELTEKGMRLSLSEPSREIAPGQSCVLYRADLLLGGGVIVRS